MTTNYDPRAVSAAFLGKDIRGFADGTFLEVTPSADLMSYSVGAQGDVAGSVIANNTATVSFTVQQHSEINTWLNGLIQAAKESGGQWPEGAFVIKDKFAPTIPVLRACKLYRRPTHTWATEQTNVTWELFAEDYDEIPQTAYSARFLSQSISALATYESLSDFLETL